MTRHGVDPGHLRESEPAHVRLETAPLRRDPYSWFAVLGRVFARSGYDRELVLF